MIAGTEDNRLTVGARELGRHGKRSGGGLAKHTAHFGDVGAPPKKPAAARLLRRAAGYKTIMARFLLDGRPREGDAGDLSSTVQ